MSREVLIFMQMDDVHPGHIVDYLIQHDIPHRLIRVFQEPVPEFHDDITGMVFMGGVMSANDDLDWLKRELKLIEKGLEQDIPLMGHCLGGQLISKVCGARIHTNPLPEIGWHRCQLQDNQTARDWLGDLVARNSRARNSTAGNMAEAARSDAPETIQMFHWHFETFELPHSAQLLYSSAHCRNQAYVMGDSVLAMQSHVEMTEDMVRSWVQSWETRLPTEFASVQSAEQILDNLQHNIQELRQVANQLYSRWVQTLIPRLSA